MDPITFYGRSKKTSLRTRPINGYDSDDVVLASDSDEERDIEQLRQNIIVPESDSESELEMLEDDDDDNAATNTTAAIPGTNGNVSNVKTKNIEWKKVNNHTALPISPWKGSLPQGPENPHQPIHYFRKFIDEACLENVKNQTNLYAVQRDPTKPINTTEMEIEQFIGCCFYMSIYGLPSSRMYWKAETRVGSVADTMSRNSWEAIKSNLHFSDNANVPETDSLHKIRPFLDSLVTKFNNIPMDEKLCVDEQMIPFKGKHNLKVYIKNKPKKWGYKAFVLCDSQGIVHNFELYTGKTQHDPTLPDVGVSGNVVLRLSKIIPRNMCHKLYFDNWFSGIQLEVELEKSGIQCLGTVRPNRLRGCEFTSDKEMKKNGRGSVEEHKTNVDGVPLRAIKWFDSKAVHLLSTFVGVYPTTNVQRWDRSKKERISVQCPSIIMEYNKFMGGVDLMDSLIALYRTKIRSKKWYHRIIFHLLDMTVVNAWLLYRRDCTYCGVQKKQQYRLRDFKASIAASLCQQNKTGPKKRGRPSSTLQDKIDEKKKRGATAAVPTSDVRTDEVSHWPIFSEKRGRCKKPGCDGVPKVTCSKCKVHLCLTANSSCFLEFHTE